MSASTSPRTIEYIESNFSPVNAHAEGIVDNERQYSRLKRFTADRALIKNIAIIALIIGVLAILLAFAYNRAKAPVIEIVEKPVYIPKPEIQIVKVPHPGESKIIESTINKSEINFFSSLIMVAFLIKIFFAINLQSLKKTF